MTRGFAHLDDEGLTGRLVGLRGPATGPSRLSAGRFRVVSGDVVLDSARNDLDAFRSSPSDTRQVVLQAEDVSVVLDVTLASSGGGDREVNGQVVGAPPGAVVQFVDCSGREVAIATVDDGGVFEVVVSSGELELFVAAEGIDIGFSIDVG